MSTGKYQLVAELARGGMGVVYLAVANGVAGFQKLLVLKQLKEELAGDTDFVEMFLAEARTAASLQHPNVVQTYEVGIDEGRPFLVMDYLDGYSLVQIVKRHDDRFSRLHHYKVLCEVLRGLEYIHQVTDMDGNPMRLVHRDLTPQNVLVTFDGQVKIIDFGIAKGSMSSIETQAGTLKGKPAYMSPEQLSGKSDARTDLFAVGVMLWEAATGRRMWPRRTDTEIITALLQNQLPSLQEVAPGLDPELAQIIHTATATNIDERYQDARTFRLALEGWLAKHPPVPSVQDVGEAIATVFATDREARKQRVDAALKEVRSGAPSALPQVQVVPGDGTPSNSSALRHQSSSISNATHLPSTPPPAEPRRGLGPLVQGGLLLLAVGLGAFLALRREPAAAVPVTPPAPATSTQSPASLPRADIPEPPALTTALSAPSAAPSAAASSPPAAAQIENKDQGKYRPARSPAVTATTAPTAAPTPAADCNPPFYFQGTKKVFKPGCL